LIFRSLCWTPSAGIAFDFGVFLFWWSDYMSYELARVIKRNGSVTKAPGLARTFDPLTGHPGLSGSGVAGNTSARAIGRRGGSSGFGAAAASSVVRRNAPRGFSQGAAFAFGGFDPVTGLGSGGTASTARARRGSGLRGYGDDGLGFSLARFKINKKSITRPLASVKKNIKPILATALAFVPLPGGSLASRALSAGKAVVNDVKKVGLTLAHATQPDGSTAVVATDSAGAIVSKPLPVSIDLVPANAPVLPANAIQAPAAPAVVQALAPAPAPDNSGITSILDYFKGKDAATAAATAARQAARAAGATPAQADQAAAVAQAAANANAGGGGGGGGGGARTSDSSAPTLVPGTSPDSGAGESLLQNPAVLIAAAAVAFLALRH
jgi:hypothetical protein